MKVIYIDEEKGLCEMEVDQLNWAEGVNIYNMQVLKSAAGYYIGMLSKADWSKDEEFWEPFLRDSECYYGTREEAENALRTGNYPVKF